jgi:diguanylate cyclase (GGDEF)-like protein
MGEKRHGTDRTAVVPEGTLDPVDQRIRAVDATESRTVAGDRSSSEAARDLARLVADELRVPAAVLARELRELRRVPPDSLPAQARRALASIEQQARSVNELSGAIRELEALERADPQPRDRPVDLGAIVSRVVAERASLARAEGIGFEVASGERNVLFPGDPDRLTRAVEAVLDGVWRALRRGGAIRILVQPTADGARIDVEGNVGGPRPARRRPRLATASLAVARKIAAMYGGALEVVHDAGTVAARLALRAAPERMTDLVPAVQQAVPPGRARILVVDDDQDAREALSMILGDDHEVYLAADGHEALQQAMEGRPHIVLMDLYMPRMDGLAALEALRAEPTTEDIPVILISARGDELTRSRCLDLGAVDFLQKPFSGRELKARIERTLRLTRRETELQALARTDPLTGLGNLRAFRNRLDEEVKRARRYRTSLACVMVDMDNLKPINDQFGHAAGDQAIRALADVLRHELRETDFGARYGGDEFVLLLPHTTGAEARVFAERVCARLASSPLEMDGARVPLGASFGIAALLDEVLDRPGDTLLRRADAALYAAKRAGRGRVAAHPSADVDVAAPAP